MKRIVAVALLLMALSAWLPACDLSCTAPVPPPPPPPPVPDECCWMVPDAVIVDGMMVTK